MSTTGEKMQKSKMAVWGGLTNSCEKRQRRPLHNDQRNIQEEDITIVNIYAPNREAPQYVRQMLTSMKGEINSNPITLGNLIPHLHLWIDQLNRKLARKHKL